MKQEVIIKEFLNEKGQERYIINDVTGKELHKAGGAGFKSVATAEAFAASHDWTVIVKPDLPEANPLI